MLLSRPAVVCQDGIKIGGVVAVVEGVSWRRVLNGLGQRPMSPSGTRLSHIVGGVVAGGPAYPSSTSVSYFRQSCNIRSTYVTSVCCAPLACEHGRGFCRASIVGMSV